MQSTTIDAGTTTVGVEEEKDNSSVAARDMTCLVEEWEKCSVKTFVAESFYAAEPSVEH